MDIYCNKVGGYYVFGLMSGVVNQEDGNRYNIFRSSSFKQENLFFVSSTIKTVADLSE